MILRLKRIETGADGWQGAAWLTERLLPQRYSKPEVQISLSNSFNQTTNALSITVSPEEIKQIEAVSEPIRQSVREMFANYKSAQLGNGNGERTVDVEAQPVEPEAPIKRKEGEEQSSAFWAQFCGNESRSVEKKTAIFAAATIVNETVGRGMGNQAITMFKSEPVVVSDVLRVIERLCGGPAGWQTIQRKAGF
jgi:hypothetical protein